jgi:hypothetical protein
MNVRIVNRVRDFGEEKLKIVQNFTKFAQNNSPLKRSIEIVLMDQPVDRISNGVQINGLIKISAKDRMLIDILRNIANEWAYEFARQRKIKLQSVNGEEQSTTEASIMITMFESQNPQFVEQLYNL